MPIRVALFGTGNCGRLALIQLIEDPRFELVAVGVSNPDKVGRDAGQLAGLDETTGITASLGLDAILAAAPDAAVYCAMGDTRPIEATRDVKALLAAGINVVGSAPNTLQFPWGAAPPWRWGAGCWFWLVLWPWVSGPCRAPGATRGGCCGLPLPHGSWQWCGPCNSGVHCQWAICTGAVHIGS